MKRPKSAKEFIEHAKRVLEDVAKYEVRRDTEIQQRDLDLVKIVVKRMIECAEKNELPAAEHRNPELARLIVDQWPLHDALGENVIVLEKAFRKL